MHLPRIYHVLTAGMEVIPLCNYIERLGGFARIVYRCYYVFAMHLLFTRRFLYAFHMLEYFRLPEGRSILESIRVGGPGNLSLSNDLMST
jgi:hypothetical protein